ncbi:hypothetical protein ACE6H2_011566 [Prunus campanulata]
MVGSKGVDLKKAPIHLDHEVDVPDIIEENCSQSQQKKYEQFFNDIPNECFNQVDENFVKIV